MSSAAVTDTNATRAARRPSPPERLIEACTECNGTGIVIYWNEVAYFDDRRSCTACRAGREMDARIGEIIAQGQLRDRLAE